MKKSIFKMLAIFMLTFFFSKPSIANITYEKVNTKIGQTKITYFESNVKYIIDTEFNLKENQDTEVIYFFSYNCETCYIFQEYFMHGQKIILKNNKIKLKKIPLYENEKDINGIAAKIYFLRNILGFNSNFDDIMFELIHEKQIAVKSESDLNSLFLKYGKIEKEKMNSEEVQKKLKYRMLRTKEIIKNLEVTSTPTIIIHKKGKRYKITATSSGTPEKMLLSLFYILKNK